MSAPLERKGRAPQVCRPILGHYLSRAKGVTNRDTPNIKKFPYILHLWKLLLSLQELNLRK